MFWFGSFGWTFDAGPVWRWWDVGIVRLWLAVVGEGTDTKTKSHALLDEFLTESVPEIDVAVESIGAFDEVSVEIFVDETTPFTRDLAGSKEALDSATFTEIVENRMLELCGERCEDIWS